MDAFIGVLNQISISNNPDKTAIDALKEFPLMKSGSLQAINYTINEISKNFFRTQEELKGFRLGIAVACGWSKYKIVGEDD